MCPDQLSCLQDIDTQIQVTTSTLAAIQQQTSIPNFVSNENALFAFGFLCAMMVVFGFKAAL